MTKDKFYRVKKDTFLWDEGAILKFSTAHGDGGGYQAFDEMWEKEATGSEYISAKIIEGSPEWFERVYKVPSMTDVVFEVREKAKEIFNSKFKK